MTALYQPWANTAVCVCESSQRLSLGFYPFRSVLSRTPVGSPWTWNSTACFEVCCLVSTDHGGRGTSQGRLQSLQNATFPTRVAMRSAK